MGRTGPQAPAWDRLAPGDDLAPAEPPGVTATNLCVAIQPGRKPKDRKRFLGSPSGRLRFDKVDCFS